MAHNGLYVFGWVCLVLGFTPHRFVTGVPEPIRLGIFLEGPVDDRLMWLVADFANNSRHPVVFDIERNVDEAIIVGLDKLSDQRNRLLAVQITMTSCDTDALLSSGYFQDGVRLSVTSDICDVYEIVPESRTTFHISPPAELIFSAVRAVLGYQTLTYSHVFMFHDESAAPSHVHSLVLWVTSQGGVSTTSFLPTSGSPSDIMRRHLAATRDAVTLHYRSVFTYLLVLYREEHARTLLALALEYDLVGMGQSWLVAGRDVRLEVMDFSGWTNRNLVFLTSDLRRLLNLRICPFTAHLLANHTTHNLTNAGIYLADAVLIAVRALAFPQNHSEDCPSSTPQSMTSLLKSTTFTGLSHKLKFDERGYNTYVVYDIHRIEPAVTNSSRGRPVLVGTWSGRHGLVVSPGTIFRNHFTNFENQELRIAMIETPPFVMITMNTSAPNNITYSGFCVDLINELKSRLNFSYVVVTPELAVVGQQLTPGKEWSGEIGMVMRGEADLIAGPVTITMERTLVVDFTAIYMEDDTSLIMKKPDGDRAPLERVFEPFHLVVWGAVCGAVVVFSLFLAFANQVSPSVDDTGAQNADRHVDGQRSDGCLCVPDITEAHKNLTESHWCILAHIFGQSAVRYPSTVSGRTLVVFWWLSTILISAYYTANLAAKLTAPLSIPHIESINQLADQKAVKPLIKKSVTLGELFKGSPAPSTYATIWEELQSTAPFPLNNREALNRVLDGGYAFMSDSTQLRYALAQHCDLFVLAKERFYTGGFGLVVPKNAIYRDAFSTNIAKMREAGLIDHLSRKYWPENMCAEQQQPARVMLDFWAVSGAFGVCAIISAAALFVFAVELKFCNLVPKAELGAAPAGSTVENVNEEDATLENCSRL